MNKRLQTYLPIFGWMNNYSKGYLKADLLAGFTVGVLLIPQGMAYALIAGLPAVYGLYAAMIPPLVYLVLGTSRKLAVGPVAMDSMLVAAGLTGVAIPGSQDYIGLAISMAIFVGVFQLLFGFFRMGFLVNFLSKPVISGFTSAAAILIALSQLKHVLGVPVSWDVDFKNISIPSLSVGLVAVVLIVALKYLNKRIPAALLAVLAGVVVMKVAYLDVATIGEIPEGLPSFRMPGMNDLWEDFQLIWPISISLALIAFMESISIAKSVEQREEGERVNADQELRALGLANVVGGLFGAYPTAGGFSRTAVNNQAGAKTNLSSLFSSVLLGLVLLYFTSFFQKLPMAVLGAIIIVAIVGLINVRYPRYLWRTSREDFWMLMVTFCVTLFVGIKEGLMAGVLISIGAMVYRSTRPHYAILGRLPGTYDYRNIARFKDIENRQDVLVFRYDSQLYFANSSHFVQSVKHEVELKGMDLKLVVFHCGSISRVDSTALEEVKILIDELIEKGIQVAFSGLIGPVRDFLLRTNAVKQMGVNHFFRDVQGAIEMFDQNKDNLHQQAFDQIRVINVFGEKEI